MACAPVRNLAVRLAAPEGADLYLVAQAVGDIIARMSFEGAGTATPMPTIEGQVVQDADRLGATGALLLKDPHEHGQRQADRPGTA